MIFEQVLSYFACAGWHFFAMAPTAALSKSLAPIALSTAMAIEGSAQRIAQSPTYEISHHFLHSRSHLVEWAGLCVPTATRFSAGWV